MQQARRKIADFLLRKHWLLATAESCTGGLVAAACTGLPGASAWFERGFVTYSNAAKVELLGLPPALIEAHGAVSEPVARAMAEGAARRAQTAVALAVTGIAGPAGGSAQKPVGTVWFGWQVDGLSHCECQHFGGTRAQVRQQATAYALQGLWLRLDGV